MKKFIVAVSTAAILFVLGATTGNSATTGNRIPRVEPAGAAPPVVTVGRVDLGPTVVIAKGATPEREAELLAALRLFQANGLELPDLDVYFFDSDTNCKGHYGLFQNRFTPSRILVCSELAFVLPHELAHAWEAANLTDRDRETYASSQGFSTWDDHSHAWQDRAEEDAAFIIQQNLTALNVRTTSSSWKKRMAAYELLTGMPSPLLASS